MKGGGGKISIRRSTILTLLWFLFLSFVSLCLCSPSFHYHVSFFLQANCPESAALRLYLAAMF